MLFSLVLSYSETNICCAIHIFLVDLFQTNSITPRVIKIKSFNAADRVITIEYMHFNPSEGKTHRLTHILFLWDHYKMHLGVRVGYGFEQGRDPELNLSLCHPVGGHAVVVLTVAACRPHQQRGGHHVERWGYEGQVKGPAQRAIHLIRQHRHFVEQIHPRQVATHCG